MRFRSITSWNHSISFHGFPAFHARGVWWNEWNETAGSPVCPCVYKTRQRKANHFATFSPNPFVKPRPFGQNSSIATTLTETSHETSHLSPIDGCSFVRRRQRHDAGRQDLRSSAAGHGARQIGRAHV